MKRIVLWLAILVSTSLILASWMRWLHMDQTEVLGFVTGAWCVWLTVKENIWNWPIGIANSLFFIALFLHTRLYADMGLQVVYVVLGILGWYWWLYGSRNQSRLPVAHTSVPKALILVAMVVVATTFMTQYLRHIQDTAPFWDAITTTLSLAAQ